MRFLKSAWKLIEGSRGYYIYSLLVQILMVASSVSTTFMSKILTDSLTSYGEGASFAPTGVELFFTNIITFGNGPDYLLANLWLLPVAFLLFGLLTAALTCYRTIVRVKCSTQINKGMQYKVFAHMSSLPFTYFKKHKSGDILQTATRDLDILRKTLMMDFSSINYTLWIVIFCTSILLTISPKYCAVCLSVFPIMFIYSFLLIGKVRRLYRATDDSEARMTTKISDNLNAVRVVKAYNAERNEIAEFEEKLIDYKKHFIAWRKFSSFFWSSSDIFIFLAKALSIVFGIYMAYTGEIDYGTLVIGVLFVNMMVWPLRDVATILSNLGQALASMDRVNELLDSPSEDVDSGLTPELKGHIVFSHVSFTYDDGNEEVIDDVSFEIQPGQTVAIMGKTGSGKSTLFYLLTRLYDYSGGSITIDGFELRDIQKKTLRHQISPVWQDPFLFSKSILENIRLAKEDADQEEIYRAARIASVDDAIRSFKDGYATPVGEKGVTLSGGQKQRVAIARTIVSDAPILIFDDSLSAVDTETDIKIRSSLRELGPDTTSIIITQRVMSAKDADLIIVLDNGKVEAMGKHEDLIARPGLYQDIYEIQSKMA